MRWLNRTHRTAIIAAAIVTMLTVLTAGAATAHGGHEHPEPSGVDASVFLQAGGTAIAIGAAYLIAARILRHRDAHRTHRDG
jgi:hypothetical protein